MELPSYVFGDDLAFPYRKKPGFKQEIPFADSFVINRVMGGYHEDGLRKFGHWDGRQGRRSLDYAVKGDDGKLHFRPDLIEARLRPYLDAGYKPSDITLALDNTPWDLATPDGQAPKEGVWGRRTPPGDWSEWGEVVRRFASDLKAYLGEDADKIGFETGVEYDERQSFDGDAATFFHYYEVTDRALHAVLPRARLNPGEFTAAGVCKDTSPNCVYDSKAFLEFAAREGLDVADTPRSLHAFLDRNRASPAEAAQRSVESYRRLPATIAEIHQFGVLEQPFGRDAGDDPGPIQATFEFQTLVRLMAAGPPRRVFHWGGFVPVGKLSFLDGSGVLRLVLDHYVGDDATTLALRDTAAPFPAETLGLALTGKGAIALMLSSFSARPQAGSRPVSVDLPDAWKGKRVRAVRYSGSRNVFATLKRDLAAEGNLRPEFAACALCLGKPVLMASDANRARALIVRNASRYEAEMHDGLKWAPDPGTKIEGRRLTTDLEANELLIVEPQD